MHNYSILAVRSYRIICMIIAMYMGMQINYIKILPGPGCDRFIEDIVGVTICIYDASCNKAEVYVYLDQ